MQLLNLDHILYTIGFMHSSTQKNKEGVQLNKHMADVLPGLIPSYLAHDAFHPHQVFTHHWEELHLVGYWSDLDTTGLTRAQQLLPRLHHLLLFDHDGLSLLTSIDGPQLGSVLLQLPHLHQDRMKGVSGFITAEYSQCRRMVVFVQNKLNWTDLISVSDCWLIKTSYFKPTNKPTNTQAHI